MARRRYTLFKGLAGVALVAGIALVVYAGLISLRLVPH